MRLVLVSVAGVPEPGARGLRRVVESNPDPDPDADPDPDGHADPARGDHLHHQRDGAAVHHRGGVQRVANAQFVAPAMGSVFSFTPAQNGYTYTLLNGTVNPSPSEAAIFTRGQPSLRHRHAAVLRERLLSSRSPPAPAISPQPAHRRSGNPLIVLSVTAFGMFEEEFLDDRRGPRRHIDSAPVRLRGSSPAGAIPTTGTATFKRFGRGPGDRQQAGRHRHLEHLQADRTSPSSPITPPAPRR
jgi:hypothetical protein